MALYKKIRDLREDNDKTQTEIAEYLGTTAQYYGKYENGEREIPFSRAIRLAEYYNVSLDYLAGRHCYKLNDDETQLLNNWQRMSERNRGKIEYIMSELLEEQAKRKEAK